MNLYVYIVYIYIKPYCWVDDPVALVSVQINVSWVVRPCQ